MTAAPRYDRIGAAYARTRKEDPRISWLGEEAGLQERLTAIWR